MTHSLLSLRPYQKDALAAVWDAWNQGLKRPAAVLPTGAGKTVIFSHMVDQFRAAFPKERALILVHRDELADQALAKLASVSPGVATGKVKAEHDHRFADVIVASVQTLSRQSRLESLVQTQTTSAGPVGLIITDECHHAAAQSYRRIYDAFPDARHLGVTATMARGDGVGLGSVWEDVVYQRSILRMIADGYLVDVRSQQVTTDLDLGSVKRSGGDYQVGALGQAMQEAGVPEQVAKAIVEYASDRRSIVFTPTVDTAYDTVQELEALGIRAAAIDGTTPREVRQERYAAFASGQLRALVNCMVLTEGFDMPQADCVVVARPTTSQPLYVQMVGRGLRTFPGKSDCLVLNVAGASGRISTLVDLAEGEPMPRSGLKPKESLAEAAIRAEEELKAADLAVQEEEDGFTLGFRLKRKDTDLFAGSDQTWLRTHGGVPFVPAGDEGVIALWPSREIGEDGSPLWDVAFVPRKNTWVNPETGATEKRPWKRLHEALPMGTAMAWAETEADDFASFGVRQGAAWRKKRATQAQLFLAERMRLPVHENMRAGEVGDLLSVAFASRTIDPFAQHVEKHTAVSAAV